MRSNPLYPRSAAEGRGPTAVSSTELTDLLTKILASLGELKEMGKTIMSDLDDLKSTMTDLAADAASLRTDFDGLLAKANAVPQAGMTPEQTQALADLVSSARDIHTKLGGIHQAATDASQTVNTIQAAPVTGTTAGVDTSGATTATTTTPDQTATPTPDQTNTTPSGS